MKPLPHIEMPPCKKVFIRDFLVNGAGVGGEAVNFFLVDAFRMDLSVLFGDGFGLLVFGVVFVVC